jgi:choline-sulfatase
VTRRQYWDLYDGVEIEPPTVARPAAQDAHNARLENVIDLQAVDVSEQDILNARRAYYGNVSYVDEWLGRLRATLAECGMAENTTIIFTTDHGDMLGEFGLWYKMSFREWSNRIPLIVHQPGCLDPGRVSTPVAQVDLLPTLVDIASDASGVEQPTPIEPLHGRSLLPLCLGEAGNDPDSCVSEYLAEGTAAPMLMIRRGKYKYICCETDPDQLFDLENDPNELENLVEHELIDEFRRAAESHWDSDALKQAVICDQDRRRAVHAALRLGRYQSWDFNPVRDASEEYTRSHMDLTNFDIASRYPRPKSFTPKQD